MRVSRILSVVLLAMASQASSGNRHVNGKLLCVGVFDEEYLKGAREGPWQALCPAIGGYALRPTTVRMTAAPPLAGDNGPRPRRDVEALECPDALVLIRLASLTDGHVSTSFSGRSQLRPTAPSVPHA